MAQKLDDHRKRVKDDAFELILAVKIVEPLLSRQIESGVPTFLRRILTRYAILGVTRLLAPAETGKTGTTASLRSLIALARRDEAISAEFAARTVAKIDQLAKEFERDGFSLKDLVHLRHTQIAHTLIPHQVSKEVWMHTIIEVANALFGLVKEVEETLVAAGCEPLTDISAAPAEWEAKSIEFWTRLSRDSSKARRRRYPAGT